MFGMAYAIDCVFLSSQGDVVGLVEGLRPWCLSPYFAKASGCLELPVGTISSTATQVGDRVLRQTAD